MVENLRLIFNSGVTKPVENRIAMLYALEESIRFYENEIIDALWKDLHKYKNDAYISEISMVYRELTLFKSKLRKWGKVNRIGSPWFLFPSKSYTINIPYGVSLIISPWNYPFLLLFQPLIASLGAGNVVFLKPSSSSLNTTMVTYKIIERFNSNIREKIKGLSGDIVAVEPMELLKSDEILNEKFDHIFFTGGERFGRVVASKAASDLTPVVLELGGKSPCIVTPECNIEIAARRIIWAKLMNAGQTCVAPDYILVDNSIKEKLVEGLKEAINRLYPDIKTNKSYGRIISAPAFERLQAIVDKYSSKNKIIYGGEYDYISRYIEPTLVNAVSLEDDEIFGPILPILSYDNISQAKEIISFYPTPLAMYYFGDESSGHTIMNEIKSGGGCINDCIIHLTNLSLPFGGMGASGMGRYHGKYGFETFSHKKGYMSSSMKIDLKMRYNTPLKIAKRLK